MIKQPDNYGDVDLSVHQNHGDRINWAFTQFMPMFYAHINCIINRYKSDQYDLNESQIKIIMAVDHLGEMSPVQISKDLHIFKGSLTTMIRGLIAMGMLTRKDDPSDARKYYLSATNKARRLIGEKKIHDAKILDELFSSLPEADLEKACEGLLILAEYLKKVEKR